MEHARTNTCVLESLATVQNVVDEADEWALLIDNYDSSNDDSD